MGWILFTKRNITQTLPVDYPLGTYSSEEELKYWIYFKKTTTKSKTNFNALLRKAWRRNRIQINSKARSHEIRYEYSVDSSNVHFEHFAYSQKYIKASSKRNTLPSEDVFSLDDVLELWSEAKPSARFLHFHSKNIEHIFNKLMWAMRERWEIAKRSTSIHIRCFVERKKCYHLHLSYPTQFTFMWKFVFFLFILVILWNNNRHVSFSLERKTSKIRMLNRCTLPYLL